MEQIQHLLTMAAPNITTVAATNGIKSCFKSTSVKERQMPIQRIKQPTTTTYPRKR